MMSPHRLYALLALLLACLPAPAHAQDPADGGGETIDVEGQ